MTPLTGIRVLIVEDEGGVALLIEDMLQDLGCEIAASVAALPKALELAATADLDLAVLDINLDGHPVFPVADILWERGVPLVFSTGYGASGLPQKFKEHPVLGKPFSAKELEQKIALAINR